MLNKSKNKVGRTGNKWVYALLMAFPVLHFCVFYVYVNANSIAMAFQNVDPVTGEITFTFANFADQFKFLTTGPALNMLRVSLLGYVIHLVVGLTTGLMFAYYVYKKRTMSSMFRVLMFLPSIIPAIVLVTIYRYFADNAFPEIIAGLFNLKETPQGLFSNNETRLAVIIFTTYSYRSARRYWCTPTRWIPSSRRSSRRQKSTAQRSFRSSGISCCL